MTAPYWTDDQVTIWHANALDLPLEDETVDLIVTSPPYFALRSYQDRCPDCDGAGKTTRPDSHGHKVCPDCGNVANRKRCNLCGASMKWPPSRAVEPTGCVTCNGTGSQHYDGQIGSEPTPAEYVDALIAATREMVRVLKPSGSIFVNLGDKYSGAQAQNTTARKGDDAAATWRQTDPRRTGIPNKSLMLIPERYRIACVDQLGLIARAVIVWGKPNGLPESVTDRVRRSHEDWVHLTRFPKYYSAVDEIREGYPASSLARFNGGFGQTKWSAETGKQYAAESVAPNPLGKLPGSVWTIPTQPLRVPPELGIDHFAAFPMEWPRRLIRGFSPRDVCTACGEGRRPVARQSNEAYAAARRAVKLATPRDLMMGGGRGTGAAASDISNGVVRPAYAITGYACACTPYTDHPGTVVERTDTALTGLPGRSQRGDVGNAPTSGAWREYHWDDWTPAPTTPGVVLDPFGGTGTTGLVAKVEGRTAHLVDLSRDYCRLAQWRVNDPGEIARAMQVEKPAKEIDGQDDLLALLDGDVA